MTKKRPMRKPRYDIFAGQASVFIIDRLKIEYSDPVIKTYTYPFSRSGVMLKAATVRRAHIECARLNRPL